MEKAMAEKKKKIIFYSALLSCSAAVVLRCLQFFMQTDLQTGHLKSGSTALSAVILVLAAGAVLLSFFVEAREGAAALSPRKNSSSKLFMLLSGAALFYDFVRQCLNVYNYFSKNSYVKWNYIIPLALFGLLALASALYFAALAFLSGSSGYDFKRVHILHYLPLFWAVFGLLTSLTVLEDLRDVQQAVYKTAALIFATLFFAAYAAAFSQPRLYKRMVPGFGLSYSFAAAIYSVPELLGLIFGVYHLNSVYFAGTFLLTGAFAFAASCDLIAEKQ